MVDPRFRVDVKSTGKIVLDHVCDAGVGHQDGIIGKIERHATGNQEADHLCGRRLDLWHFEILVECAAPRGATEVSRELVRALGEIASCSIGQRYGPGSSDGGN